MRALALLLALTLGLPLAAAGPREDLEALALRHDEGCTFTYDSRYSETSYAEAASEECSESDTASVGATVNGDEVAGVRAGRERSRSQSASHAGGSLFQDGEPGEESVSRNASDEREALFLSAHAPEMQASAGRTCATGFSERSGESSTVRENATSSSLSFDREDHSTCSHGGSARLATFDADAHRVEGCSNSTASRSTTPSGGVWSETRDTDAFCGDRLVIVVVGNELATGDGGSCATHRQRDAYGDSRLEERCRDGRSASFNFLEVFVGNERTTTTECTFNEENCDVEERDQGGVFVTALGESVLVPTLGAEALLP